MCGIAAIFRSGRRQSSQGRCSEDGGSGGGGGGGGGGSSSSSSSTSASATSAIVEEVQGCLSEEELQDLIEKVCARGPDHFSDVLVDCATTTTCQEEDGKDEVNVQVRLLSSVLHIQGDSLCVQPAKDDKGNLLLWNGEVFGGTLDVPDGSSDTFAILDMLGAMCNDADFDLKVAHSLSGIWGPYAFIYYNASSDSWYFGRDPFGRRSLLVCTNERGQLVAIASCPSSIIGSKSKEDSLDLDLDCRSKNTWTEVPISGVYKLKLSSCTEVFNLSNHLLQWPSDRLRLIREGEHKGATNSEGNSSGSSGSSGSSSSSSSRSSNRSSNRSSVTSSIDDTPNGCVSSSDTTSSSPLKSVLKDGVNPSDELLIRLKDAISRRVKVLLRSESGKSGVDVGAFSDEPLTAPVGVLFSGGIDSVVLAAVLHLALETHPELAIDLINVTFEPPPPAPASTTTNYDSSIGSSSSNSAIKPNRKHNSTTKGDSDDDDDTNDPDSPSPDRLAAIAAVQELGRLFPSRKWNLLHVDVTSAERFEAEARIRSLILPNDDIMDLNIGTAFWFASRGLGYKREHRAEDVEESINLTVRGRSLLRIAADGPSKPIPRIQRRCQSGIRNCNRVHEPCSFSFCKRCCIKLQQTENSEYIGRCKFHILGEITASKKAKDNNSKTSESGQVEGDAELDDNNALSVKLAADDINSNSCDLIQSSSPPPLLETFVTSLEDNIEAMPAVIIGGNCTANDHNCKYEEAELDHVVKGAADADPFVKSVAVQREGEGAVKKRGNSHKFGFYSVSDEDRRVDRCACKALLIGIGADEQMAGYGRHRSAFLTGGLSSLVSELNRDLTRLWKRNLGRDDRCVSDHGREAWFPFLDESVVQFLHDLPLSQICNLELEAGFGDKIVLRRLAESLGLSRSAQMVKRAIQFGTRIAQHSNIIFHGSHRKGKKKSAAGPGIK